MIAAAEGGANGGANGCATVCPWTDRSVKTALLSAGVPGGGRAEAGRLSECVSRAASERTAAVEAAAAQSAYFIAGGRSGRPPLPGLSACLPACPPRPAQTDRVSRVFPSLVVVRVVSVPTTVVRRPPRAVTVVQLHHTFPPHRPIFFFQHG
uniref:Uncharacterized protein n=1 Tax=Plectus sambesii TaxID=2011161 RepID=A0A914WEN8_9BILA